MPYITSVTAATAAIGEEHSAQGNSSVLTISAVERVPVEVWRRILCISISCPLIPRDDDDYFQRRDVANFGCAKIYQYVKSEQVRTKLCLVCHSWNTFLGEHSDRLVHLSSVIPGAHWPPVKKWYQVIRVVGPRSLTCTCVEWCPLTDRISGSIYKRREGVQVASSTMEAQVRQECLSLISTRCRAIIWPYTWRNDTVDPDRFGSVTTLADEATYPPYQLSIISTTYRKLTHLTIVILLATDPSFTLDLPRLTFLTLSIPNLRIAKAGGPASTSRWILPSLRCITFMEPFSEIAIYSLLEQVGKNVDEFHIQPDSPAWGALSPVFRSRVWSLLPKASIFGGSFIQLLSLGPPAGRQNQPITLLVHFGNEQKNSMLEEASIMELRQQWASSNVGQVRIDIYWSQWINISNTVPQWFQASALKAQLRMFDVLNGMGDGLYDRAGFVFGSTIKSQLYEVVETLERGLRLPEF